MSEREYENLWEREKEKREEKEIWELSVLFIPTEMGLLWKNVWEEREEDKYEKHIEHINFSEGHTNEWCGWHKEVVLVWGKAEKNLIYCFHVVLYEYIQYKEKKNNFRCSHFYISAASTTASVSFHLTSFFLLSFSPFHFLIFVR